MDHANHYYPWDWHPRFGLWNRQGGPSLLRTCADSITYFKITSPYVAVGCISEIH